jgi:hypothetical protein
LITAGDGVAHGTADFILLTLVRNRVQQELIAINVGLGAAVVIAALARGARDLPSLAHPRTAVLWIPYVLAYALTIGLRAAFFVPSELRGSWTFRVISPKSATAYWSAIRASMMAVVLPPTALIIAFSSVHNPAPLLWMTASVLVVTAAVDVIARGRTHRCSTVRMADDVDDTSDVTVLDLATPVKVTGQNAR